MKKIISLVCAFALMATAVPSVTKAEAADNNNVYVLMNIPYSEFYEAETNNNTVKVDAFSSATKTKTRTGSLAGGSYHPNADGDEITGVTYPVKLGDGVTLDDLKSYQQITDDSKVEITTTNRGQTNTAVYEGEYALFESPSYSYYVIKSVPDNYKELTIVNGEKKFSKVKGEKAVTTVESSVQFTTNTGYGDYQLNLDEDTVEKYVNHDTDRISGVVVTTTDGTGYGMRHLENLWLGYELAWCTGYTDSIHNCPTSSEHYKSMMGKTIDYVTYYTDKGIFKFDIADTYVPVKFDYTLDVNETQKSVAVTGLPEKYQASYAIDGKQVNAVDGKVSTEGLLPGKRTLTVSDTGKVYADVNDSFVVSTSDNAAVYNEQSNAIVAAEGADTAALENYIVNISSVNVNGKDYAASGRGSVKIINNDGSIAMDAAPFEKAGDYSVTVKATGFTTDLSFTLHKDYDTPSQSQTPSVSETPAPTKEPSASESPAPTNDPSATEVPAPTNAPSESEAPAATETPAAVTKPAAVKSVKVKAGKKKLSVTWKKVNGASGYEVKVTATAKKAVTRTVKVNKITVSGLKSRKKYSVKVRAYKKNSSGKNIYGAWSAKKTAKVK